MASNPLSSLFGKSPISPIQSHMGKVQKCTAKLTEFMQAALADDWQQAAVIQQAIAELENEADDLKKQLRISLPKSLFLPVPRSDLLDLIRVQDRIANRAKDVAGLMLGRKMRVPASLSELMLSYVQCAIATTNQAGTAISELDELLETGFRGREVELVERMIEDLDTLEHENDELQVQVRAAVFELEAEINPVDAIFLYKVIDWIGEVADYAQRVGARLQILIAR